MNTTINKYLIPGAIVLAGILIAGAFVYLNYFPLGVLSSQAAADKAIAFINENIEAGAVANLVQISEENNVYKISLKINETPYESYITKDGKFLFPSGIDLEQAPIEETTAPAGTIEQTETVSESFAKCLTANGAKLYGAWWCSHCQSQKKMFGDALQYVNYIECEQVPGTSQGSITDTCKAAEIQSFPTWDFADGTRKTGRLTASQLSELAGCSLQ